MPLPASFTRVAFAALPLLALALAALSAPAAHAQANLTFSGGSGSPLTITLAAPVTYTVTSTPTNVSPFFAFVGVGNLFNTSAQVVTSTLTYSINGGTLRTVDVIGSGSAAGSVSANDVYAYSSAYPGVSVGDTVVLFAGSVTTNGNVTAAAPQSGSYTTFLFDGNGNRRSSNGVSVAPTATAPEPGTIALLLVAGVPVFGLVRRRKKALASA